MNMYAAITGESIRQNHANMGFRLMVVPAMGVSGLRMPEDIDPISGRRCLWYARLERKIATPGPRERPECRSAWFGTLWGRGRWMHYRKEQDPDIHAQANQEQN